MKSLFFILSLLLFTNLFVKAQVAVGSVAPSFVLTKRDGNVINSYELKGKVLLVTFWATWCGPCNLELPKLQEVYNRYHPNSKFAMCTIAVGENYRKIDQFNSRKYNLPFIADESMTVFNSLYGQGIPYSIIINQYGIVAYVSTGYNEWEFNNMVSTFNSLLN